MKEFLVKYRLLLGIVLSLLVFAKIFPPIIPMAIVLAFLFLFTLKQDIPNFLILFFLLLFFSDSRQELFIFAKDAKTIAALLLPINLLGIWRKLKYSSHLLMHVTLFLIIAWLTVIWSDNPSLATQKTLSYTIIVISVPSLFIYCFQDDKVFFKDLFHLFSILMLVGILLKFAMPTFVIMEKNARFTGLLGNPNGIGIFITLSFLYFQILKRTKMAEFNRSDLIIFYISLFASLFYCKSRTAMMTVLIFYSLNIIYNYSHFIGWLFFFTLAYLYEYLLEGIPIVTDFLGFSEDLRVENVDKIKKGSGRMIAWLFIWEKIQVSMFFGHGISATEEIFIKNYKSLSMLGHEGNAHNTYLTMWYDTGLIGVVSFVVGVLTYFIKVSKELPFVMPALFAIFFSIYYESWLSASLNPFTSMFLIVATLLGYIAMDYLPSLEEDKEVEVVNEKDLSVAS